MSECACKSKEWDAQELHKIREHGMPRSPWIVAEESGLIDHYQPYFWVCEHCNTSRYIVFKTGSNAYFESDSYGEPSDVWMHL